MSAMLAIIVGNVFVIVSIFGFSAPAVIGGSLTTHRMRRRRRRWRLRERPLWHGDAATAC
jgi:hypothetical protein